ATLATTIQLLPSPADGSKSTATMPRMSRPPYCALSSLAKLAQYCAGTGTIGPTGLPCLPPAKSAHPASSSTDVGAGSGFSVTVDGPAGAGVVVGGAADVVTGPAVVACVWTAGAALDGATTSPASA